MDNAVIGKRKNVLAVAQSEYMRYVESIESAEKFNEFPKLDVNPFMHLLGNVLQKEYKTLGSINGVGNVEMVDKKTGEIVQARENKVFTRKEFVDSDKFLKIYNSQLKEMFNLSYPALKVYGYFISEMQNTKDDTMIYFHLQDCMDFCDYNVHGMVYAGLTELIKKLFICKAIRHPMYYINPLYAFNGSRIILYSEYINNDYYQARQKVIKERNEAMARGKYSDKEIESGTIIEGDISSESGTTLKDDKLIKAEEEVRVSLDSMGKPKRLPPKVKVLDVDGNIKEVLALNKHRNGYRPVPDNPEDIKPLEKVNVDHLSFEE